jgi:hypothetical protein
MNAEPSERAFAQITADRHGMSIRASRETFTASVFLLSRPDVPSPGLFLKVLKSAATPAIADAFDREVDFYRRFHRLLPPGLTPRLVELNNESGPAFLLLQDLSATHVCPEWPCPPTRRQAATGLSQLARLHAWSLGEKTILAAATAAPADPMPRNDEADDITAFIGFLAGRIGRADLAALRSIPGLEGVASTDRCLLMGDAHFWNMLYAADGETAVLVDWQDWSIGSPVSDLAYIISLQLCPATYEQGFRRELFDIYTKAWSEAGGPTLDRTALWQDMLRAGLVRALRTCAWQWSAGLSASIWTRTLSILLQLPEYRRLKVTDGDKS